MKFDNKKNGEKIVNESKKIPVLYERKEECCGCTACFAICPKEAIKMVANKEGFDYPEIDADKCIRCYKCIKVCPLKNEQSNSK